ncbi:160_t:CDS:2, partial [Racocetra persica]
SPTSITLSYDAHKGRVREFSIDPSGIWLVSGSDDKTIRMWKIMTGRCVKTWDMNEIVQSVVWCPNKNICAFAVAVSNKVMIISPPAVCDDEIANLTAQY